MSIDNQKITVIKIQNVRNYQSKSYVRCIQTMLIWEL